MRRAAATLASLIGRRFAARPAAELPERFQTPRARTHQCRNQRGAAKRFGGIGHPCIG